MTRLAALPLTVLKLRLSGHDGEANGLAFTSDGRRLASGGVDGTVRLWNLEGEDPGTGVTIIANPGTEINALAIGPDDQLLVAGGEDGEVRLWDLSAPDEPLVLSGHDGGVNAVAISPDGRWLASGGADEDVRL